MQLLALVILEILAGAEVDLFVPSFPELQTIFSLTPAWVELTLSLNFVAFCLCTIIVGDLGDRYGRKVIIQSGLGIFIGGSILCLYAESLGFWALLVGRFFQGAGISAPATLAYVIIADQYPANQQEKLLGILNGVVSLAMAGGPVLGSYVSLKFGWMGNFYALLIYAIIGFLVAAFFIKSDLEKKSEPKNDFNFSSLLKSYKVLLLSPKVMSYILLVCLWITPYWTFVGMAPILYMEDLGISLSQFGYYQGTLCLVFSITSLLSGFFIKKYGQKFCFYAGLVFMGLFLISLLFLLNSKDPFWITFSMLLMSVGLVFPITIIYPILLGSMEGYKARISSLVIAVRLIFTAVTLQAVSLAYTKSFHSLALSMIITIGASFILTYSMTKKGYIVLKT